MGFGYFKSEQGNWCYTHDRQEPSIEDAAGALKQEKSRLMLPAVVFLRHVTIESFCRNKQAL